MAYLKFSRDKRGYEHFYLVQPSNRGKARPRLLYWFRTPPNVKVGRSPFAPEIRRALEAQNPDVAFDWDAIVHTPIPPPMEPERWRERRRVERALKAASRRPEEAAAIDEASEPAAHAENPPQVVEPAEAPEELSPRVAAAEACEADEPMRPQNRPQRLTCRQLRRSRIRKAGRLVKAAAAGGAEDGENRRFKVQGSRFKVRGSRFRVLRFQGRNRKIRRRRA